LRQVNPDRHSYRRGSSTEATLGGCFLSEINARGGLVRSACPHLKDWKRGTMRVLVETSAGHGGVEMPRRFRLDGRKIEVTDNLDQWHGAQDRYFKLMGDDGNLYILRLDEKRAEWELIMFQSPHYREIVASTHAGKEQRRQGVACG
jgi:hypothetical protein